MIKVKQNLQYLQRSWVLMQLRCSISCKDLNITVLKNAELLQFFNQSSQPNTVIKHKIHPFLSFFVFMGCEGAGHLRKRVGKRDSRIVFSYRVKSQTIL